MTPLERAARAVRDELGIDWPYAYSYEDMAPIVRAVIAAIRIDDPLSPVLLEGRCTTGHWNRMIDVLLSEGE